MSPSPSLRRVRSQFLQRTRPLVVFLDDSGSVQNIHGDLARYGYSDLRVGCKADLIFDFLIGLTPPVIWEIPFLETPAGRIACVEVEITDLARQIVLTDVTQQHMEVQTQQQLANDHALALRRLMRMESLVDCMFQFNELRVWSWDVKANRLYFDNMWASWDGGGSSAVDWDQMVVIDDRDDFHAQLQHSLNSCSPFFEIEHRVSGPGSDRCRWVLTRGTVAERDESGQALCVVGIQLDIDRRKCAEINLRESEQRFRMLGDSAPVMVWMADENAKCTYLNQGWRAFMGENADTNATLGWLQNVHAEDRDYCLETCEAAMARQDSYELEYRQLREDGEYRWFLDRGVPRFDSNNRFLGYIGTCADITERVNALSALRKLSVELEQRIALRTAELEASNAALRKSEERYALVARATEDGLWDWDLVADKVYYSPRWKSILGYEDGEIGTSPREWYDRVHPDDTAVMATDLQTHLSGPTCVCACEYRMLHKDGTYHWYHQRALVICDDAGKAVRLAGAHRDITHRKAIEEQLRYDAIHDGLTGLANRTLLLDRLRRCIDKRRRDEGWTFALMFMDLDRFKVVNDSLGHIVGDRLLVEVARRLQRLLRADDTLARLGGDEFAILLEDIRGQAWVIQVAERVHRELGQVFDIDGNDIFVGASIGIALSTSDYTRADDMIRDADTAMYKAKAQGLQRYQIFDSRMHAGAMRRLRLENDLRSAIDRQQMVLLYQPVVNVRSGDIVGLEALLRWRHPDFGIVSPNEFISLAEETGLIVPIGAWVLKTTCLQASKWQQSGIKPVRIAVNLSSVQFRHSDLTSTIRDALDSSRLEAGWLDLEVTESTLMQHMESAISTMRELKDLGLMLSMDDFGTGYSSLSCLKHFPLDTLKIDQSFVRDVATDSSDAAIVTAIGAMAMSLNMDVVAEGVETSEQLQFLVQHDCKKAQGFYFSPPVTASGALQLLRCGLR